MYYLCFDYFYLYELRFFFCKCILMIRKVNIIFILGFLKIFGFLWIVGGYMVILFFFFRLYFWFFFVLNLVFLVIDLIMKIFLEIFRVFLVMLFVM